MTPTPAPVTPTAPAYDLRAIPLELIRHSTVQPRRSIDAVRQAELVASVREKGIETPIGVRPIQDGLFEVVRGERRTLAAETAGVTVIPCLVKAMTDAEALESALVENTQRHDMNVVDEAHGYANLQKADKRLYTVATIARRTGQPESRVYKLLKLVTLEKLFLTALAEDRLTMGHAERLLRLTPQQRADAHDQRLIWSESPLFEGSEKSWVPAKEELQPIAGLDAFIRDRTTFDPTAEDVKHFQPGLAAALDDAMAGPSPDELDDPSKIDAEVPTVLRLSDDSLVRMKTGAKPDAKDTPLSPSKWKPVKPGTCPHAQLGAVVHGGPARVLTVCVKRSCAKHWPQPKKAKASKTGATKAAAKHTNRPQWEIENERRQAAQAAWDQVMDALRPVIVDHLRGLKLRVTVALVRSLMAALNDEHYLRGAEEDYEVKLTDETVPLFLALVIASRTEHNQASLTAALKPFKFDVGLVVKDLKAHAKEIDGRTDRAPAKGKKPAKKGRAA